MRIKGFYLTHLILAVICLLPAGVWAQRDTLIFTEGDMLIGEIKSLDQNVLVIKTIYSKSDFTIKWDKIREVHTQTEFIVELSNDKKYYGSLRSKSAMDVEIWHLGNILTECKFLHIVSLNPVKDTFLDRLSASVDLNFTSTKSRNAKQVNSRMFLAYSTEKWSSSFSGSTIFSSQDNTEDNSRSEATLTYRYFLATKWYPITSFALYSNTEQRLKYRFNTQLGFGHFFIRNNKGFWGAKIGANRNIEEYTNETPSRQSWEGFVGTELILHNAGDLTLSSALTFFPGLTEWKRYRSDFSLDVKYDLPLDFYIRIGGSLSYDNQPAEDAGKYDYDVQTGFGWKWNK